MAAAPSQKGRFLTGSTMGHVVRMTMTGAMGITFVFLVDAANLFWISQLGDPRLMAAIGFAFAIQFFSVSSGIGLMIAATAMVSRSIGAGDRDRARRNATSAAILACAVQGLMALTVILFRHQIVAAAGATGETAALAARYLAITLPSLTIMAVALVANGTLRAEGDGARSMTVTLCSGTVALLIEPFLILRYGLDGAAAGLVVSRCVMLGVALYFTTRTYDLLARPALRDLSRTVAPFFAIALPAILTQLAAPVGNYLLTRVMAEFGDDAVAGWAVVGRLTVVAFGGLFSLSGAIGGIFGQNFGARQYDRLKDVYRDALIFGLLYTLVTWGLLVLVSGVVIDAFGLSALGGEVVRSFAWYGAGGFGFASALFVSSAAFNALGRPRSSTLFSWLRDGVLTLPLALWLSASFGASGVIYSQIAASAIVGTIAGYAGWRYVCHLGRSHLPSLDLEPPRPYAHADRFRRR